MATELPRASDPIPLTVQSVLEFFANLGSYSSGKNVHVVEKSDERTLIRLYTATNRYGISIAEISEDCPRGYLGCIVSTRKPRAGEDWTRGNDLPDGPLNDETLNSILRGILAYELEVVAKGQLTLVGLETQ